MKIERFAPGDYKRLEEQELIDLSVVKVALLIRGRNAWHSTWVQHYIRDADLYTDLDSAKKGAEILRERGNVFYVQETFALELQGESFSVIVVDANSDAPFEYFHGMGSKQTETSIGTFADGIYPGVRISEALAVLDGNTFWNTSNSSNHLLLTGILNSPERLSHNLDSSDSYKSQAVGTDYFLRWNPLPLSRSNGPIVNVLQEWQRETLTGFEQSEIVMSRSRWVEHGRSEYSARAKECRAHRLAATAHGKKVIKYRASLSSAEEAYEEAAEDRLTPATTARAMANQRLKLEKTKNKYEALLAIRDELEDEWDRLADIAESAEYDLRRLRSELLRHGVRSLT